MTGAEKLKQIIDSGEFAEVAQMISSAPCPEDCGFNSGSNYPECTGSCADCWRKALESEVKE